MSGSNRRPPFALLQASHKQHGEGGPRARYDGEGEVESAQGLFAVGGHRSKGRGLMEFGLHAAGFFRGDRFFLQAL